MARLLGANILYQLLFIYNEKMFLVFGGHKLDKKLECHWEGRFVIELLNKRSFHSALLGKRDSKVIAV